MNKSFSILPETASKFAGQVDLFYFFMVALTVFWTVLIALVVTWFAVRYRRRSAGERPSEIHGNNRLEIAWTVLPLLLALGIFFWGAHLFFSYARTPSNAMEILVTGKQWMWKIQQPNGKREINELHVPVGQPIQMTMTSEDVVHSMYIPAFRVKTDVVPGRYTKLWFEATKLGTYHLFCAEYCGTEHSKMGGWVHVMTPADYEAWLGGGAVGDSPVAAGEKLFTQMGCMVCHGGAPGAQGPKMAGVFGSKVRLQGGAEVLADENYIRESILNPTLAIVEGYQPVMPPFKGLLNETQIMQLVAYVKSIGATQGGK